MTSAAVDITLLVCTFNRCNDLRQLLESARVQETGGLFTYEILVVDNNSTDGTRDVVEEFIGRGCTNLRYHFEGRQGKSYALNSGLAEGRGNIYSIIDDDQVLPLNWLKTAFEAFDANPDVAFLGGKVLPIWLGPNPSWRSSEHWSVLGLSDYGNEVFAVDERRTICLLACSFRRSAIEAVGGYRAELGISQKLIGAVEDLDIIQRLIKAGFTGLYLPDLQIEHKVPPQRLTKRYHRRWHTQHGRFYALLRDKAFESSNTRLLDAPGHVYRQAIVGALQWVASLARGRFGEAFAHETSVRFSLGFLLERLPAAGAQRDKRASSRAL